MLVTTAASENDTRQIVELRYKDYPDNLLLWCLLVEEITAGYEGPLGNPGDRAGGENSCEDTNSIHVPTPRVLLTGLACRKAKKGGVHNVHTFGFGLGRMLVGSGRFPHVSGGVQCLQGRECSSSPTSGTAFPLVRGGFCFNVCTLTLFGSPLTLGAAGAWPPRWPIRLCGWRGQGLGWWAGRLLGCGVIRGLLSHCRWWAWLALYLFMPGGCGGDMT